jgi:predicted dehydrogenase
MLGPVARVAAMSTRSTDLRKGLGVNAGKTFPVEVDTHISATLEFASGAVITLIMSFDVWHCGDFRDIELFGTEGSIHAPDPNCFGGEARFMRQGLNRGWAIADNQFGYTDNMRFIGLADMAAAIERGRPHRCSGELAFHVLDVMCSICDSAREGSAVALESKCGRPEPLRLGLKHGELD